MGCVELCNGSPAQPDVLYASHGASPFLPAGVGMERAIKGLQRTWLDVQSVVARKPARNSWICIPLDREASWDLVQILKGGISR